MSTCKKITCPECLPDFAYYINRLEAVFNVEQTIELECPPGYVCEKTTVTIPGGGKKIIPDLPEGHPDNDPECNYQCEADGGYDPYQDMKPKLGSVGNDAQTATCEDLGLVNDTGASWTIPANTYMAVVPQGASGAQYKAALNTQAFNKAKQILQLKINQGQLSCEDSGPVPTVLFEDDSTDLGERVIDGGQLDDMVEWGNANEAAVYVMEYVSGMVARPWGLAKCPSADGFDPYYYLDSYAYFINQRYSAGVHFIGVTRAGTLTSLNAPHVGTDFRVDRDDLVCSWGSPCYPAPDPLLSDDGGGPVNCKANLDNAVVSDTVAGGQAALQTLGLTSGPGAGPVQTVINNSRDDSESTRVGVKVRHVVGTGEVSNLTDPWILLPTQEGTIRYNLRRTRKQVSEWPMRLRVANLATIVAALRPCLNMKQTGLPAWDGTFPYRRLSGADNDGSLEWRQEDFSNPPDAVSIIGTDVSRCRVQWRKDHLAADPIIPMSDVWEIEIFLRNVSNNEIQIYSGVRTTGGPAGSYIWVPESTNGAHCRLYSANPVELKTTAPLPACARGAGADDNKLVANANGSLPLIDGVDLDSTPSKFVLVTEESDQRNNGLYFLAQAGDGGNPWKLQRAFGGGAFNYTQYSFVFIRDGTAHINECWELTTAGTSVEWTDDLSFGRINFPQLVLESY